MKRSENKGQKQSEEKKQSNVSSRFQTFIHYFDIFYRVVKALVILLVVILLVVGSLGAGTAVGYFASLVHGSEVPKREEMISQIQDYTRKSNMYYADGSLISDIRSDLLRTPVSLDNVSDYVIHAIVSTEDEYFFEHEGVVPKAVARALVQELSDSGATTGGSTLTQQLIKQQILSPEVTHERKANEILLAYHLENEVDKDQILEAYLNVSPFGRNNKGQNIAGVEEAAQGIFGVSASDVSLPQAAFIAGLPQRPIVFSPYTQYGDLKESHDLSLARQDEVLFRMYREGYISEKEYEDAQAYDITQDFINKENIDYKDNSYVYDVAYLQSLDLLTQKFMDDEEVTDAMVEENPEIVNEYKDRAEYALKNQGYKVYTTIDKEIHNTLERVTSEYIDKLGGERSYTYTDDEGETHTVTRPINTSGAMIDNQTGRVLGFIGGRDYDYSQFNIAFDGDRQPGSVIKPLAVYGPALDENLITPATIIPDTPYTVPDWDPDIGDFVDKEIGNATRTTNEWMTARKAITISQNIPASKIWMELKEKHDPGAYIRRAGFGPEDILESDFDNASFALGGLSRGLAPVDLISAFSSMGNDGVHMEPYVIERIENSKGEVVHEYKSEESRVFSTEANYLLVDMLRDVHVQGTARGTMDNLPFEADWISKTGTTQDRSDIWYVAGTPKITFGTWIGYGTNEISLGDDFGIHPSRRNRNFWTELMSAVYEVKPDVFGVDEKFPKPDSVTRESVIKATGMKSGTVKTPGGGSFYYSGATHSENFKKDNVPGSTVYDFAIGASDEELAKFWGGRRPTSKPDNEDESESNDSSNDNDSNSEDEKEKESEATEENQEDESEETSEEEQEAEDNESSNEESSDPEDEE
ncbi:transglycosylase domain-containing protein [Alkalibacterium kapii]|uniref:Penicillin-binding protein 1B n=1 Tax=Alkalibacterium kapii TaxID=426704 RepID=A0A511ATD2_9LACT|nr:transglycosylase domain-containing protein [Alkalibacterium kapii]GEK91366.1 penicillin-binding protein 1B [Alkalibacterium kapii]